MTTRFKNAIDALIYAFFNDTLAKGICTCCAVGSIVAAGFGRKLNSAVAVYNDNGTPNSAWGRAFRTNQFSRQVFEKAYFSDPEVLECVIPTGYSILELARVEKAFEENTEIDWINYPRFTKEEITQDQYKGLLAVVEVLCEIEGIQDPTEYRELFTTT